MRTSSFLALSVLLSFAFVTGCGEDKKPTDDKSDAAVETGECPTTAPDEGAGLTGACCYRESNADKANSPEFRLAAVDITSPESLATPVVASALTGFLDAETFNWLVRLDGLDGEATYTTGFGDRHPDNTFSFRPESDEFAPATGSGSFADNVFSTSPAPNQLLVPILDAKTNEPTVKFALTNLSIEKAKLTEERSCIGKRVGKASDGEYTTTDGDLSAYITVADAKLTVVEIKGVFKTSLCNLTAGLTLDQETNCDGDQTEWKYPPNAKCEDGECAVVEGDGPCSADDCNAWKLTAVYAAQGVDIADGTSVPDASTNDAGDDGGN